MTHPLNHVMQNCFFFYKHNSIILSKFLICLSNEFDGCIVLSRLTHLQPNLGYRGHIEHSFMDVLFNNHIGLIQAQFIGFYSTIIMRNMWFCNANSKVHWNVQAIHLYKCFFCISTRKLKTILIQPPNIKLSIVNQCYWHVHLSYSCEIQMAHIDWVRHI